MGHPPPIADFRILRSECNGLISSIMGKCILPDQEQKNMEKSHASERDDWVQGGEMITSRDKPANIAAVLERTILIVEHRHYRGASSPTRLFSEDKEDFLAYLNDYAGPGDSFRVWPFDLCIEANASVSGKYPDELGRVPRYGAY